MIIKVIKKLFKLASSQTIKSWLKIDKLKNITN